MWWPESGDVGRNSSTKGTFWFSSDELPNNELTRTMNYNPIMQLWFAEAREDGSRCRSARFPPGHPAPGT